MTISDYSVGAGSNAYKWWVQLTPITDFTMEILLQTRI